MKTVRLNKKMSDVSNLITFIPAQLSKGKEWFVYYYVVNPATDKLQRKRIKINRIKSIRERQKFANLLIDELNERLYSGWNPFVEKEAPKGYEKLAYAMETFFKTKERELRPDSLRSYRSFIDNLAFWLKQTKRDDMLVIQFSRKDALEYMNYLYMGKQVSNTTWNNYLRFNRLIFAWMIERQYCTLNHFDEIRKKRQEEKKRIVIPEETRTLIKDHLEQTDYDYLIVCLLVFHALIRPKEISFLKPSSFALKNQTIFMPAAHAKNKQDRIITIPDALMPYLVQWNFSNAMNDEFIYSEDDRPGRKPISARRFSRKWSNLRVKLKLPMEMKLYSLRDSGIIQMLNDGISPQEVMKQADHSSLEITSIYAKFANPNGSEQIKKKGTGF